MSTKVATFDLPQANPLPASRAPMRAVAVRAERPWGFWGSLGWGLLAVATGLSAIVICAVIWRITHQFQAPHPEDTDFAYVAAGKLASILASVVPLAVLGIAVKIRGFSLRDYFALEAVRRRDLVLGIACLTVLLVVGATMESLLGIDGGSNVETTYRTERLAGTLPLLWLLVVVVAPVTEELLFRGFLHCGWASSWLGVPGTIVLTSALWAALHLQYNWLGILVIFLMGLIFGSLRQHSGSTTLTIVLHAFNNLFVTVLVTVKIEWLS
jgi:uncharacterized protein